MKLSKIDFQGMVADYRDMREEDFEAITIKNKELRHASFHKSNFKSVTFNDVKSAFSDYTNANFESCVFLNCIFNRDRFWESEFLMCNFIDCEINESNLRHIEFNECEFTRSKIIFSDLRMGIFDNCNLNHSAMTNNFLEDLSIIKCTIENVSFDYSFGWERAHIKNNKISKVSFPETGYFANTEKELWESVKKIGWYF